MLERVQGHCPACGGSSLLLGNGGYVTCSRQECPNPTAVADILESETAHIVTFADTGFIIRHPLIERLGDDLAECELHRHVATLDGPPVVHGTYRARKVNGRWSWERMRDA